jgi:hypothetical protein
MSVVLVMRRAREKPSRTCGSGASVFAGELDCQPLASLLATAAQDFTSPFGGHARAKSVCPDTALVPGTIRWLAHSCSNLFAIRAL